LFPHLEATVPEPLTKRLYDLIVILELRRVEQHGHVEALSADRASLLRAFLTKAVLKIPTTKGSSDRLQVGSAVGNHARSTFPAGEEYHSPG
jgi:hypothetical protein